MAQVQNIKYFCGCGKTYSSYPAFSTHKKQKHNNVDVPGTILPTHYNPKRGRPSFTTPQRDRNPQIRFYSALTVVEVGLLRLEQTYKQVMSKAQQEADLAVLNKYLEFPNGKTYVSKNSKVLIESIKRFNQSLITHLREQISIPITTYLHSLTIFLLDNLPLEEVRLTWENPSTDEATIIDSNLFNKFFHKKANLQKLSALSQQIPLPKSFFFEITVMLSEWLVQLGQCNSALIIKS